MALFYNYAVVDPKYPGEPHYWGLEGFGFGDAAVLGWTFEFAPDATKTTQLLTNNLQSKQGRISLAVTTHLVPSREPKWALGTTYDQLLISVSSDAGPVRKLGLYKLRVLKVGKREDSYRHRIFKHPVQVALCQVTGGGYVAGG